MKLKKMKKKNVYSIILARGGSKGIKNKNLIKVNNKPLIFWTISQSLKSRRIDQVWVSSDSKKILSVSKKLGAKVIERPKKFSSDIASSESAWLHAIKNINTIDTKKDIIIAPQVTSPMRKDNDFDKALKQFTEKKLDTLFSGFFFEAYFSWIYRNNKIIPKYNLNKRIRRQKLYKNVIENGSFYIFKVNKFLKKKNRLFGKIGCYLMNKENSFQIDEENDLKLFKFLSNKKGFFK